MNLNKLSNNQTICLNMIVKNEEHIILDTLKNLLNYIQFDYWVISDTGSTDNTKNIILNFFSEKKIPGELVEHEWVDFAYNRTRALECAFNKTDYLLIFDADDSIIGDFKLPFPLTYDLYQVIFGKEFSYVRPLLITNRKRWKFNGVLHEFLSSVDVMNNGEIKLDGNYYVESGRSGNRSKNPNKYLDDAIVLKIAFEKEINGGDYGMACRYAFYCAQSYKDSGFEYYDDSIEWYKRVLELKGWNQEKYYACYTIGNLYKNKKDDETAVKYWLKTIEYDDERIEGIINAIEYYRNTGLNILVNSLYHKFKNYKKNLHSKLFISLNKYNDELEYHNSISAYYVGDFENGYLCCKKILLNSLISENLLHSTLENIIFYKRLLENDDDTLLLFYKVDEILSNISKKNTINDNLQQLWNILFNKNKDILSHANNNTSIKSFLNSRGFFNFEGNCQSCEQQIDDLIHLTNKPNIKVMEIGFNAGHSCELFLKNNNKLTVTSFDLGEHDYVTSAKEYIDITYPNRHKLILGDSRITLPMFIENNKGLKFDIIFIDGGHDYEIAKADMENCFHLANKDTIVILDDTIYTPGWEQFWTIGPTRTWSEHIQQNKIIELNRKDYSRLHGMSWGKYTM